MNEKMARPIFPSFIFAIWGHEAKVFTLRPKDLGTVLCLIEFG